MGCLNAYTNKIISHYSGGGGGKGGSKGTGTTGGSATAGSAGSTGSGGGSPDGQKGQDVIGNNSSTSAPSWMFINTPAEDHPTPLVNPLNFLSSNESHSYRIFSTEIEARIFMYEKFAQDKRELFAFKTQDDFCIVGPWYNAYEFQTSFSYAERLDGEGNFKFGGNTFKAKEFWHTHSRSFSPSVQDWPVRDFMLKRGIESFILFRMNKYKFK